MFYIAQFIETQKRFLTETRTDAKGVLRWRSNGYVTPPDVTKMASNYFLTPEQVDATTRAWAIQDALIWAPIHAFVANRLANS